MKCLIVEDNFTARKLLQIYLSPIADCSFSVNGQEAVEAVRDALDEKQPYDFICLDIMMPEMDGRQALEEIRKIESEHGICGLDRVKVIMTTALSDSVNIMNAFNTGCESYLIKPIRKEKLLEEMTKLGIIQHREISKT
jgi:two-component system chemotaxis response regulator CheY